MKKNITIGIPTHKRPKQLSRCLNFLIKKDRKFLITISVDGIDETYKKYKLLEKKYKKYEFIKFIYQRKNIGSLKNFFFLKKTCKTKYFMWLADDDLISFDTVNKLYDLLSKDKKACTAVPYWELHYFKKKKLIKPAFFDSNYLFVRIFKYLLDSDDAFFYGLHKTKYLNKCNFSGYYWPNRNVISNWCYVFQMDLIIQGKILFLDDKKYKWVNHDYGIKYYDKGPQKFLFKGFSFITRKLNIYFEYLVKLIKWRKIVLFFLLLIIFPVFLLRDIILREPAYRKVKI